MSYPTSSPQTSRGRLTESGPRARVTMLDGGARHWRVTSDPSKMFMNGIFRESDLSAGGFEQGTTFTHIRTGEQRIADANGVAQKAHRKLKEQKKKIAVVKPSKRIAGTGGTHAIL